MEKTQTSSAISARFLTPAGEIIGWRDGNVIRASGIPYASASRFQPPAPIPPFSTPFLANKRSPACPQSSVSTLQKVLGDSLLKELTVDENCQRLSITLPHTGTRSLPVMVWIHGGSYTSGAGDALIFDPKLLVAEQEVIVVSITYRLGLFGFLGGYSDREANLGLLDMIEALRWIKKNIDAFGGDANNITLFGQSAGGDAIAHLMIADGVRRLFQRAIIQSAPLGISRGRNEMTRAMWAQAEALPVDAPVEEVIAHQEQVSAVVKKFGLKAGMPFGTQYGHLPLPKEEQLDNAWLSNAKDYDVLIGTAANETAFFIPFIKSFIVRIPFLKKLLVHITSNKVYKHGALAFAQRHAKGGGRVYHYTITWGSKTNGLGPSHTIDLPLLFGDEEIWKHAGLVAGIPWTELYEHGKKVRALWAQFARSGMLADKGAIHPGVLHYEQIVL